MIATTRSGYLAAGMAVVLLPSPWRAEDPAPKSRAADPPQGSKPSGSPTRDPVEYRKLYPSSLGGGEPFDLLIRGGQARFGRFDPDGNFSPEPYHEAVHSFGMGFGPISFIFTNYIKGPCPMAEHRSGRLILGTMVKGVFVPEIGSKVLDIKKDFDVKKPERIVYNLQETLKAFWAEEQKKEFPKGVPDAPKPPPAGTPPAGWKLVPFHELHHHKQDPWQVRVIGDIAEFGHLDSQRLC